MNNPNPNAVYDVAIYQGNTYIAGNFDATIDIEDIAMYNGSSWQSVGTPPGMYGGFNIVGDIEVYNNELYVVGSISKADGNAGNNIQKWDGTQWYDVGGGLSFYAEDLKEHNNELYVVGSFEYAANGLVKASKIAKWDGSQWCGLRDSIDNTVLAIEFYHDTLIISGGFWTLGGDTIHKIAQWTGGAYTDTCNVFVGIEEIFEDKENGFLIYPNPNNGNFTIEMVNFENASVEIYNISGQLILNNKLSKNLTQINLTNFSKGMYFVKVNTTNKMVVTKIIYQ